MSRGRNATPPLTGPLYTQRLLHWVTLHAAP